ncbi:MAG: patatin-like phospholipase family protein [Prevotellaceae bacterium]|jgi:patatin-like phospholipase/acyl hydrolase|nr:patatin-like phospholipase family protein [Prevotellaceae bacterium]
MYKILSIDGGGIRGIIPAVILSYLEEQLRQRTGSDSATLADYFDMVAGTSTGGILACFYLLPPAEGQALHSRYAAKDAVDLYARRGKEIFSRKRLLGLGSEAYSSAGLERVLLEVMGEATLADARKDCLITAYDIAKRQAMLFTGAEAQRYAHRNYLLRDVARATSAAPTYFEPAQVRSLGGAISYLVDGGMYAGNPALCAYVEARKKLAEQEKAATATASADASASADGLFVLSIGTGKELKKYDYHKAKGWGLGGWARPVLDILLSSSAEVVDYQLRRIFAAAGAPHRYRRLEPALHGAKPDMDDASDKNISLLTDAANAFIEGNIENLDELAEEILKS